MMLGSERKRDSRSKSRDSDADKEKDEANKPASKFEEGSMEAMMAAMGLPVGFETTKGKHVEGDHTHHTSHAHMTFNTPSSRVGESTAHTACGRSCR
jgi:hypothetical protein